MKRNDKEIDGDAKTVRQLLANARYTLDYYQREYSWKIEQVTDLIDDLTNKFLDNYTGSDRTPQVKSYDHYFLGSIIISNTDGERFIVDGQQRLTTLTMLLIRIRALLKSKPERNEVTPLIFSTSYGEKGFNLDIQDREPIMNALYSGESLESFQSDKHSESIRNIASRYNDIERHFDLQGNELSCFAIWLLEKVYLVEITAYGNEDAYTIFETMNDRGLSLTPADMLKGYLLANITDTRKRNSASEVWREKIQILKNIGKDSDADAIKAWLRGQYAETIRERKKGAKSRDFELIGTEFHRWVRDNKNRLGLNLSGDFVRFIEENFEFYAQWYYQLRNAADSLTSDLECVYYNAQNDFRLQYPLLLASLRVEEKESESLRKIQIVSRFLDILLHRRIWNSHRITSKTMVYPVFRVMSDIRDKSINQLTDGLYKRLAEEDENFLNSNWFQLNNRNRNKIHPILARITDYVETQSANASRYLEYFQQGVSCYEVEHIWAKHPKRHMDEFSDENEFELYRNRIGGLLLLPKKINASLNNMSYDKKRDHYLKENLLAQSLHEKTYENNPGFKQFIERSGLPFQAHPEFKKADLDARQKLYQLLAEQIWNPERLYEDAS